MAAYETGLDDLANKHKDELTALDLEIKKQDQLRQAVQRAAKAKNDFYNIGKDVEIQRLERERFEDVMQLEEAGDHEGAKQANALYDFYRQQIEAKKELQMFDQQTAELMEKQRAELEKQDQQRDKVLAKERQIFDLRRKIDELGQKANSAAEYERGEKKLLRRIKTAQDELEQLRAQEQDFGAEHEQELQNRAMARAVLLDKATQGVDQAALAYDRSVAETGNALGITLDRSYTEELAENSRFSYDLLKSIDESLQQLADRQDNPWRIR